MDSNNKLFDLDEKMRQSVIIIIMAIQLILCTYYQDRLSN